MVKRKTTALERVYLEKIGRRLQMHRMHRRLSIAELARAVDLSVSAVDWHESGRSAMSLLTAYRYCVELRISLDMLLGDNK